MTNKERLKTITRRQHYVWRHYLEAWAQSDGTVRVLREGHSFAADPKNVMVQRDYYRVPLLNDSDLAVVAGLTARTSSPVLNRMNLDLALKFAALGRMASLIGSLDAISDEDKRAAEAVVIEAEEKVHAATEREAVPMLADLRHRSTEFLNDADSAASFFHFLAQQYFRTKRRRESIATVLAEMSDDRSHLTNPVCHALAVDLGGGLFRDRNEFELLFLQNNTEMELITGDQPIVNLFGTGGDEPTTDLALYYPLTPMLAVILARKGYETAALDDGVVGELNDLIAYEAAEFLVARSAKSLDVYATRGLPEERPVCNTLVALTEGR